MKHNFNTTPAVEQAIDLATEKLKNIPKSGEARINALHAIIAEAYQAVGIKVPAKPKGLTCAA